MSILTISPALRDPICRLISLFKCFSNLISSPNSRYDERSHRKFEACAALGSPVETWNKLFLCFRALLGCLDGPNAPLLGPDEELGPNCGILKERNNQLK